MLFLRMKKNGVLIRHFDSDRLSDYNRITIGSKEEMKTLIETLEKMLCEK